MQQSSPEAAPPEPAAEAIVRLDAVGKTFGAFQALRAVDLALYPGEVHGLIGANGAGKSTINKIVSGIHTPTTGTVVVDGRPVTLTDPRHAGRLGIGIAHQEIELWPALSVADNITAGRIPGRGLPGLRIRDRHAAHRTAREVLARLGADLDPGLPAGGLDLAEKKLLQIGRALLGDPRLLILDEPTAALELRQSQRVVALIERLAAQGLAVLFVSHKLDEVVTTAHRVTALRDGTVVARIERGQPQLNVHHLAELVAGRVIEGVGRSAGRRPSDEVVVRADAVAAPGVEPTDAALRRGELVTFAGVLGSGAASFARALARTTTGGGGRITVTAEGRRARTAVLRGGRAAAAALGIGFVPEERKRDGILPLLTIEQNIAVASIGALSRFGRLDRRKMRATAEYYIQRLDIRPADPRYLAGQLSGGNQQKILLARWLAAGAQVLVVEEPTHGIDAGAKVQISRELRRFADERGCVAIVALESEEFAQITDRYLVFRRHRIVADLPAPVEHAEVWAASLGDQVPAAVSHDEGAQR
ncbi:sugar ABC transporter ATP-binding protein [Dactylosporangium sp. CA-092794]|uniref:sugar ABC transporter ATP-binding protein n=1 Tax=Dactylosporangium sp. CA-092794 TaxID=3239929 RepID=UPI003D9175CF